MDTRSVLWMATMAAVVFFAVTLVHAALYAPEDSSFAPPVAAFAGTTTPSEEPARLIIPSLGIDADVQKVGLAYSGNMGIPSNFTDAAWYRYGPAPGQKGSAVMDGHVDNGFGMPGVFKHLAEITKGADIEITTKGGATLHFTVDDIELYPYRNVPTNEIFSTSQTARLSLITCDGAWVQGDRTYDHRLVVYSEFSYED